MQFDTLDGHAGGHIVDSFTAFLKSTPSYANSYYAKLELTPLECNGESHAIIVFPFRTIDVMLSLPQNAEIVQKLPDINKRQYEIASVL
eukprot:1194542-Amphidinium_carterae.1